MTSRRSPKRCWPSRLAAALLLLSGCVERALDAGARGGADLAAVDLTGADLAAVDLAGTDLARTCDGTHTYQQLPLTSFATLDGKSTFSPNAALRLVVTFAVRNGCDLPADVTTLVAPGNATTFVALSAHGWIGNGGCGPAVTIHREVTLDAGTVNNQMISVRDGASPSSEPPLLLVSDAPFTPMCTLLQPGDACDADCQCDGSDFDGLCLVATDGMRRCGRPCNEDSQCRNHGTADHCLGAPAFACAVSQICRQPVDCPFGESVDGCVCTPGLPVTNAPPSCSCDADCPAGSICGDQAKCLRVCTGDHTCTNYFSSRGSGCFDGKCRGPGF